jgi:hypothetical protein
VDARALGENRRPVLAALPGSARAPVSALLRPAGGAESGRGVGVEVLDIESAALQATELIDDEPEITRRVSTPGGAWKKLVSNLRHFFEDAIETWANEGRRFFSAEAKQAAIGALVQGTIRRRVHVRFSTFSSSFEPRAPPMPMTRNAPGYAMSSFFATPGIARRSSFPATIPARGKSRPAIRGCRSGHAPPAAPRRTRGAG